MKDQNEYSVYSVFDLEKHKQTFVHYLEVMINGNGEIRYAVPSHQESAIASACRKLGVTRQELDEMTPKEYYFDWLTWLLMQCGEMAVWEEHYECPAPTKAQYAALRRLKLAGVYKGPLPRMEMTTKCDR